jgi:hypothetical protein
MLPSTRRRFDRETELVVEGEMKSVVVERKEGIAESRS